MCFSLLLYFSSNASCHPARKKKNKYYAVLDSVWTLKKRRVPKFCVAARQKRLVGLREQAARTRQQFDLATEQKQTRRAIKSLKYSELLRRH